MSLTNRLQEYLIMSFLVDLCAHGYEQADSCPKTVNYRHVTTSRSLDQHLLALFI